MSKPTKSPSRARHSPGARIAAKAAPRPQPSKHAPKPGAAGPTLLLGEFGLTNFTFPENTELALVCLPAGAPALFSLEAAAGLTGVHPDMLCYYDRVGLIELQQGVLPTDLYLDEDALQEVRRIEYYRRALDIGRRALPLICELSREGARRQIDLRFLRCP
jgi:hypothetical protein